MAMTTGAGAISLKSQWEKQALKFYAIGKRKKDPVVVLQFHWGASDGGTDYRRRVEP